MTDEFPPWIVPASRRAPWWRDGLIWTAIGLVALGLIVGLAIGSVAWDG